MNAKMSSETNSINWFEIPATDISRAKKFYETIQEKIIYIRHNGFPAYGRRKLQKISRHQYGPYKSYQCGAQAVVRIRHHHLFRKPVRRGWLAATRFHVAGNCYRRIIRLGPTRRLRYQHLLPGKCMERLLQYQRQ